MQQLLHLEVLATLFGKAFRFSLPVVHGSEHFSSAEPWRPFFAGRSLAISLSSLLTPASSSSFCLLLLASSTVSAGQCP